MNNQIDPKRLTDSRFGGKGWSIIIYTALLYYFWAGLCVDALNVYPDAFAAKILGEGASEEALSALSAQLLGYATPAGVIGVLGGIIAGRLVLKTGVKKLTGICLIITGALYIVFGFTQSPAMFFILLTLFTVVSTEFGLIATAGLMGNWFPRKKGIALGWATMGAPLCTATFVALIQNMYGSIGITTSSAIVGVVVIILGVATFWWIHDTPEEVGAYPDNISEGMEDLAAQRKALEEYKSPFTIGKLVKDKDMWLIAVGFGFLWMVTVGIVSQFVPRFIGALIASGMEPGAAQGQALLMLTIAAVIGLFGSYFWGWLDQKIGTKKASVVYAVSYIIALILMIVANAGILQWIAVVFVGLGIGGLLNLMPSMVISVYGRKDFEAANSLVSPIASLLQKGAFIIMAAALTASHGNYNLPYGIFIGIDVVGMILLMFVTNKCKGNN